MMIKVEHLKKEFDNVTPLRDINCEINKGDVISIIGPSGTGKSTFIYCLNRLIEPTAGKIIFDGEDITAKDTDINRVRRRIGMVFQSFDLFQHLTIVENAMLGQEQLLGKSRQQAYRYAIELLETVGLREKANAYPSELSGGQQQRAAIVRALAMDPEVILFDEPTSALDPTMVGEVLSVIKNLAKKGLTMLIVTHEMKFARDVSTRVFYMDEGEIYEQGSPEQIFGNPKRPKTRQFIQRLKVYSYKFTPHSMDFPAMNAAIEKFAYQNMIPYKTAAKMLHLAEELCVQTVMPLIEADTEAELSYEYSESSGDVTVHMNFGGKEINPFSIKSLPVKIVKGLTSDAEYIFDGTNRVQAILR